MFYGGRLLNHLTASDDFTEVDEFISLRRINQYLAIVIDSDQASAESDLNATKQRVVSGFGSTPGFAWVTAGREIENYIHLDDLATSITEIANGFSPVASGQFDHVWRCRRSAGDEKDLDKVKLAYSITSHAARLDVLDLVERIESLVRFIRSANGI